MTVEDSPEWEAPPPPSEPKSEPTPPPEISEVGSLGTIFFEPERTFKDFRLKPRFLIAGIISALLIFAYTYGLTLKVGEANVRTFIAQQVDKAPGADSMSAEQKARAVDMQMSINKYTRFAIPIFVFISFFIGGLLYWLGAKAFGGTGYYLQNVAVWIYAGFPPLVLSMVANLIVMMVKSADEIDLAASQRGLLHANPGFFIDGKANPILATLVSTLDIFAIWGWILAAIGLSVVNKISKGAAWTLVIITVLIGLAFRLVGAMVSGNPS